jgi:hypothetical protein
LESVWSDSLEPEAVAEDHPPVVQREDMGYLRAKVMHESARFCIHDVRSPTSHHHEMTPIWVVADVIARR